MNIVEINILNDVGSTGKIMQGIALTCSLNNISVYTAYGYGTSNKNNSYRIGNKIDYIYHNLMSKIFCKQGCYSKRSTRKFVKYLDNIKPDIIHLHNIHGNYINYKILFNYIKKNNIPVIWTLHDCWAFTGKCTHFDYIKCQKWKTRCYDCPLLNEYPKSYFLDNSSRQFDLKKKVFTSIDNMIIVTPSFWLAGKVKDSFLNKFPIKVINNGINIQNFNLLKSNIKEKYELENKHIILGVASDWTVKKGLFDFNKLADIISDDYKIVLIGINPKVKDKLNKNILCIEKTTSVQVLVEWYNSASVFVNLTYEDTFPTVNIEALACNTPIVTYDSGGSSEIVTINNGIVCEQGNVFEVWEKIQYVCNNLNKYFNTRDEVLIKYNELKQFQKYVDIYYQLKED